MKTKELQKQTAYKAFDQNFKCIDHQFEVGQEYSHDGKIKICSSGFHSCLNPIDTWSYYSVATSRFAEVEVWGNTETHDNDSKICSQHIKIVREISREHFIRLCADFIVEAAMAKGTSGAASNSGYSGAAFSTGYYSSSETKGENSIAVAVGYQNIAKGATGTWIVLAERNDECEILSVEARKVDGKKIKADTWYKLTNGKFTEVEN